MQRALFSSVWIFMIQHLTQNITKLVWLNCQNNSYYNSRVFEKALYHLVISHLWRRYKKSMIFVTTYFRGDLISKFPTNSLEIWPPLGKKLICKLYILMFWSKLTGLLCILDSCSPLGPLVASASPDSWSGSFVTLVTSGCCFLRPRVSWSLVRPRPVGACPSKACGPFQGWRMRRWRWRLNLRIHLMSWSLSSASFFAWRPLLRPSRRPCGLSRTPLQLPPRLWKRG